MVKICNDDKTIKFYQQSNNNFWTLLGYIAKLKIHGCRQNTEIDYVFKSNNTVFETKLEIAEILGTSVFKINLGINSKICCDDKTIKFYQDHHPNNNFWVLLGQSTPKDLVFNCRLIQKLNNIYEENFVCIACLVSRPNIIGSECYHDSILCCECARKLDKCPACLSSLYEIEFCNF